MTLTIETAANVITILCIPVMTATNKMININHVIDYCQSHYQRICECSIAQFTCASDIILTSMEDSQ